MIDLKTDNDLRDALKSIRKPGSPKGISVRKIQETGEYRVNYSGGEEATAYYTDCRNDAFLTAKEMSAENGTVSVH